MAEGKISQELRLNIIDETRVYFIEEVNQSNLINKHKNVCTALNYVEH